MTLSTRLVEALGALGGSMPTAVQEAARLHLLDAIGVGLAAGASPAGRPYGVYAASLPAGPASLLCGDSSSAAEAAIVNGGLIHSLEYDDTHTGSIVHGSAVLASTALACAEDVGATGAELLSAYVAGWEMLVRIGLAAPGGFQTRGFQVTSVGGALAAAMIAARLHRLPPRQVVEAIGIALSQGSGVFEFLSNGSTVKSLHPGWAAHSGIQAARLAASGLTGPDTAIEGRFGLFASFAGGAEAASRFESMLADLGQRWYLPEAALKFSPCCHYLHPFIEAALALRQRGVHADTVTDMLCRVPAGAAGVICEPWALKQAPPTPHAARWSLPIVTAAALVEGRVDLATFEQPFAPATTALAARTRWEVLDGASFPERFEAEIQLRLSDGRVEQMRVSDAFGNASRPANFGTVDAKFRANAQRAGAPAEQIGAAVSGLSCGHDNASLRALSRALSLVPSRSAKP